MLLDFFYALRKADLKVSITEYLTLLEALKMDLAFCSIDEFYYLARASMVKDETKFDRFDKVFGKYFQGVEDVLDALQGEIPPDWVEAMKTLQLSEEELKKIQAMGGWDELMETLKKRLEEQKERHEGGNKWIGTGGTSPFGNSGANPMGVRVGGTGGNRSAVKVWEKREYANLDDTLELGTRNIKLALRRLRKFAREGAADILDLDDTIRSTARNAGYLDIKMVPERHNAVKVLLCFDVGGSMDPHVRVCEELFSAARAEFKHMEYFYFHNFVYESLWKDNVRRTSEKTSTWDLIHTFGEDYKLIFVGDATMSPYEITYAGGSVEHWNEESGQAWAERLLRHFRKAIWLNPEPEDQWDFNPSVQITREIMENRMYPLTLKGLDEGVKKLLA
ncbi:MAG: VWA domain-containing protein [Oceanococcaceae bacterium]